MPVQIEISEDAQRDRLLLMAWFEQNRQGLGRRLFNALNGGFEMLTANPEAGSALGTRKRHRKLLVPDASFRQHYAIIYRYHKREQIVRIICIWDLRQAERQLRTRLRDT